MGEYAIYNCSDIKIGTCEDLYYLRFDQRHLVVPLPGSLDPADPEMLAVIRFRFPFPDEDSIEPGDFKDPFRTVPLHGVKPPVDLEPYGGRHSTVQFRSAHPEGLRLMLPCPFSSDGEGLPYQFNGFPGAVRIVQQAFRHGQLVTIAQCGGCAAIWRLDSLAEAEPVIAACRAQGDAIAQYEAGRPVPSDAARWYRIADRIAAGYAVGVGEEVGV